jgi:hypothetical protein
MAFLPQQIHAFSRTDVQGMLDSAQMDAGSLFVDIPCLRDQLQDLFREAIEQCNNRNVHPIESLQQAIFAERTILDAYNKHRLGNAVTCFNARVLEQETAVEYREEENIPEILYWFPLRATVLKCDIDIQAPPIYQVKQTIQDHHCTPSSKTSTRKKTATNELVVKGKKLPGVASPNYNKLRDVPSPWLPFPSGNLTMAEATAFLPQSIKSFDVIHRFLHNGALSSTLTDMMNHYRTMPSGPIENNTIYRMMKGPMNVRAKTQPAYKNWTASKHTLIIPRPPDFDPASVSVANFRAPENHNPRETVVAATEKQSPPNITFRDLANGVAVFPTGYDALDLTRCIVYCVRNHDKEWYYPDDFTRLLRHLGGAAYVHPAHSDAAAVARHMSRAKPKNAKAAGKRGRDGRARMVGRREIVRFAGDSNDVEEEEEEEWEEETITIPQKRKLNISSTENSDSASCLSSLKRSKTHTILTSSQRSLTRSQGCRRRW